MSFNTEIAEEISKLQEEALFIIDNEIVEIYYKFISYIPEKWNISNLLKKSVVDLTVQEIEFLKQIKIDNNNSEIFLEYLNSEKKKSKHVYLIEKCFDDNSIEDIAKLKLTEEEYNFCIKNIKIYSILPNEELNAVVNELSKKSCKDRSILEEYILHQLKSILFARNIKKLSDDIDAKTEKNFQMRNKSALYAQKIII